MFGIPGVDVEKSGAPSGGGWSAVPGGGKGGYRKLTAHGYQYWYPGQGANHPELRTTAVEEHGKAFKTGEPVDVHFHRNKEKAPRHNAQDFGQAIEPAGRYMNHDHAPEDVAAPGWEKGKARFHNPLVLEHGNTTSDADGWKSRLSRAFGGKKGKALSREIVSHGHDGIVTVGSYEHAGKTRRHTSEIVDLSHLHAEVHGNQQVQKSFAFGLPLSMMNPGLVMMGPPPSPNREEHPYVGTLCIGGLPVLVENAPGDVRSGVDHRGRAWHTTMQAYYGEIDGTFGVDGEPVDAFVGPNGMATMAYVVHQQCPDESGIRVYDEDKVMLGYDSQEDATQAYRDHYDSDDWEGPVTAIPVSELCSMLCYGNLEGVPIMLMKSDAGGTHPSGGGWQSIPGGQHGGFRRRKGLGYEYWYPGQQSIHDHKRWEADPHKTYQDAHHGAIVEVGGRAGGIYQHTPEHDKTEEGYTWVTSLHTDEPEHEYVRATTLTPLRPAVAKPLSTKPKPQRPAKPTAPPPGVPTSTTGPKATDKPSVPAREPKEVKTVEPWKGSQAKEGTVLQAIESGGMPLRAFKVDDTRWRYGLDLPESMHRDFLREFDKVVNSAALHVARAFRINVGGRSGPSAAFEELHSGATLGLVMALKNYTGGSSFYLHAKDYAISYAQQQARQELGAGVPLPERMMRGMRGFMAARSRTRAKTEKDEVSSKDVAEHWRVKKKDVYQGELGAYQDENGQEVDQGEEQLPMGEWPIKGKDGKPVGKALPGKLVWADKFTEMAEQGKSKGSDWIDLNPITTLPNQEHLGLAANEAAELRSQLDEHLKGIHADHRKVLEMRYGMHHEEGTPATLEQIADAMGHGDKAPPTKRKIANQAVKEAEVALQQIADKRRSKIAGLVDRWHQKPPKEATTEPSQADLLERWGNDPHRLAIYSAGVRAGRGPEVEAILDKEVAGKASEEELERVRDVWSTQRDKERLRGFQEHGKTRKPDGPAANFGAGHHDQGPLHKVKDVYFDEKTRAAMDKFIVRAKAGTRGGEGAEG